MGVNPGEYVIDDDFLAGAGKDLVFSPTVDGEEKGHGCIPRNWKTHPAGCYRAAPFTGIEMPIIPQSEWSARIKEMEQLNSRISDMRMVGMNGAMIPSRDQNGKGYCWAHSSTSAAIAVRCVNNQPYADLSAYAVACIIKSYRDEGGWGAESFDFATERGIPTSQFWPQQSMSRSNDKPETWANAKLHRVVEGWVDMASAQYDRNLTFEQLMTCLLCRIPVVVDFNWWSHSVCAVDPVEVESGSFGIRIWNSWGDSWSDKGMGVLRGSQAHPNGSAAPRVISAAAA